MTIPFIAGDDRRPALITLWVVIAFELSPVHQLENPSEDDMRRLMKGDTALDCWASPSHLGENVRIIPIAG
jgi:hypothetical protein